MKATQELQSAIPEIMARMRREAEEQIERECRAVVLRAATEAAQKWATENLVPEIRAQLEAGKQGMLAKAEEISQNIADAIGAALVKQATDKLAQSWNVRKVAEALFV